MSKNSKSDFFIIVAALAFILGAIPLLGESTALGALLIGISIALIGLVVVSVVHRRRKGV